jgi:penicillin-binding protein 1A
LTRKGTDVLVRVERMLDDANRALAATPGRAPVGAQTGIDHSDAVASATDRQSPAAMRRN